MTCSDPLERLTAETSGELFRPLLEEVRDKQRKSAAGRTPFDVVLMFKVLILHTLYNLAYEAVEYQIRERLSFARFLGLELHDSVPDGVAVSRAAQGARQATSKLLHKLAQPWQASCLAAKDLA